MQQPLDPKSRRPRSFTALSRAAPAAPLAPGLLALALLAGCEGPRPNAGPPRPFEGQSLTLRCPDPAFADAIAPAVRAWEARGGAKVALRREAMAPGDDSDLAVIPAGGLGAWAEAGELAPVPGELSRADNPFQWFTLLPAYAERLVEWGGQALAVPLTGEGRVVAYRADRFADPGARAEYEKRFGRGLAAPATWAEFADAAAFFARRDKEPSLPPLPADPDRLFDLFCRVAASSDRRALGDQDVARQGGRDALAFQFSVTGDDPGRKPGEPRLTAFGFRHAAEWLRRLRESGALPAPAPGAPDDPAAALARGRAVMAVLSLDQLARLPREGGEVPARFALAPVPGAREFFDAAAGKPATAPAGSPNYVPYFCGARLGVVRARCPNPAAAFDLLADLGGPARSAEYVATPGLGAGPTRSPHIDRDRLALWLGYGLDAARTQALQDAMRHFVGVSVKNPALELRGPDRAELVRAAAAPLREIGAGLKPAEALERADAAWRAAGAKVPRDVLVRWRQRAAGLR
jgi:ABC-type glycerol-3-phosphate transport system substrate-binding protein